MVVTRPPPWRQRAQRLALLLALAPERARGEGYAATLANCNERAPQQQWQVSADGTCQLSESALCTCAL